CSHILSHFTLLDKGLRGNNLKKNSKKRKGRGERLKRRILGGKVLTKMSWRLVSGLYWEGGFKFFMEKRILFLRVHKVAFSA
ncbi:MAG: hypothetical protein IJE62_04635, partial [Clostridia bacterium]|nr:hypothetical protein [Clostridia bacterium]